MIRNPFPESCTFFAENIDTSTDGLHPAEKHLSLLYRAQNRKRAFVSGRRCAQRAMQSASFPFLPVTVNTDRSPAWPLSVVGSITHSASCAAAIVSKPHSGTVALGIDVEEQNRSVDAKIASHILTDREQKRWVKKEGATSKEMRIVFSIKECLYKCLYPLDGVSLGFHDAEVESMGPDRFDLSVLKSPLKRGVKLPIRLAGVLESTDRFIFAALRLSARQLREIAIL